MKTPIWSALLLVGLALPAQAQRMDAAVSCEPTDTRYEYACVLELTAAGEPVEGAEFSVKPDMPSMPMAHNIRSQPARPTDKPGAYAVVLPLEMYGEWALRVEVSAPERDLVVVTRHFGPDGIEENGHGHDDHGTD